MGRQLVQPHSFEGRSPPPHPALGLPRDLLASHSPSFTIGGESLPLVFPSTKPVSREQSFWYVVEIVYFLYDNDIKKKFDPFIMADDSSASEVSSTETKSRAPKICGACGDNAKSCHFGAISCDSCKAFFRRSVQNDAYKHFYCPYDGRCHISMSSRKCCQYCRFKKCETIGMEKGWVMSEEQRTELLRQRMKRKVEEKQSDQQFSCDGLTNYFKPHEIHCIKQVVSLYQDCYRELPFPCHQQPKHDDSYSNVDVICFFTLTIRRLTLFAQKFAPFSQLKLQDQNTLLRSGMVELCAIRGVHAYDSLRDCWPDRTLDLYKDSCCVRSADISRLVSADAFEIHMKFTVSVQELNLDETTLMLLLVCVLFAPDRPGLDCRVDVEKQQDYYLLLLRKYMNWRHGVEGASVLYPKLLLKLPDLRQLNDAHSRCSLRLDSNEIAQIQNQLKNLHVDKNCVVPTVLEETLLRWSGNWQMVSSSKSSSWSFITPDLTHSQSPLYDSRYDITSI
uniref:Nuclear receptor domain-containing protein n=1 Tax=Strigamia maritima TaxID=126957 RepID=T1JKD5_STRMM